MDGVLIGRLKDVTFTRSGEQIISFSTKTDFTVQFDALKDCDVDVKIKKHRKKRSADANAYCWVLCQKLAEKLSENDPKMTKDEVYRLAISKVGIFKDFCGLAESDAKTLRHAWEMLGTGWITEQVDYSPDGDAVTVRCYYGSSTYNTKQMSRLIEYLVEDCKELGIETLSPDELRRLYAQVDALHGNPESR
jgi:hypothetical protein